ncbi:hypothetical protein JCM1840_003792 [Sporobolomyces johnsonii]
MQASASASMLPPKLSLKAGAHAKGKDKDKEVDTPLGPKKRKLACEAGLTCPGAPEPKRRLKKGEVPPDEALLEMEARFKRFHIGSAPTFQLIESVFIQTNPCVPGMPYLFFQEFLHSSTGGSREKEIAGEVLCGAFVATGATFSDHALIIGPASVDTPVISPLGVSYSYIPYLPFAPLRREAVLALSYQARQTFEDSGMRHRPSIEAVWSLLAMDQMSTLATERGEGRIEREYVDLVCETYRKLLREKRGELEEADLKALQGPLLDVQTAATLRTSCTFNEADIAALFPLLAQGSPTPMIDMTLLGSGETSWMGLGKQLLPLAYSTAGLYRAFLRLSVTNCSNPAHLQPYWSQIDASHAHLSQIASLLPSLPLLSTSLEVAQRNFDLLGLLHFHHRHLLKLDLLIHQLVVEAALHASASAGAGGPLPPPGLIQNCESSQARVKQSLKLVVELAKHAVTTNCLLRAREVFEALEVCSTWTSLRGADPTTAAELVSELGISMDMGQTLEQALCLAAWSSSTAVEQRKGLLAGLTLIQGPLPPNRLPPPPSTSIINGRPVMINPPMPPDGQPSSRPAQPARRKVDPRPAAPLVEVEADLSFLDEWITANPHLCGGSDSSTSTAIPPLS